MTWLQGKLSISQVFAYEIIDNKSYLLMSKCRGQMTCEKEYMQNSITQVKALSMGLKRLWRIDISECPSDWRLKRKPAAASCEDGDNTDS